LAAIFAKNPLLRDELDEKYKNILKEQQEHQELRALLTLPLESEEFKKNQRLILIKHGKLVDILPQDGLKMELEQQLKEMGIFQ
jgi:hypothetical protein